MTPIARFLKFAREERLDCDDATYDALPDLQRLVEWVKDNPHMAGCRYLEVREETEWKFKYWQPDGSCKHLTAEEIHALCDCGLREIQSLIGD